MKKILITGGAGFIGANLVRTFLQDPQYHVVIVDALTYAGNPSSIQDILSATCQFFQGNIADVDFMDGLFQERAFDYVINCAAETHVDRSITASTTFMESNILGVQVLLECVRKYTVDKFLQVSTDEVYGSLGATGSFCEKSPLKPSSPYSASKASADMLVQAWHRTYGIPINITRCSNNYGPYQFPEKLIPLMILKSLSNEALPVYGDGSNIRDWIHVQDHCDALKCVLEKGRPGRIYNIGGQSERSNLQVVRNILTQLEKPLDLISFVEDRLGHDWRYAIDNGRISDELGWVPQRTFQDGLQNTISWYLENESWWQPLLKTL